VEEYGKMRITQFHVNACEDKGSKELVKLLLKLRIMLRLPEDDAIHKKICDDYYNLGEVTFL
jgi:hypothetical protein